MLAGMLSVLLVVGIIGAGVWAANGGASSDTPEPTPTPFAAAPAEAESATPTPGRVQALPPVKAKRLTAAARAAGCTVSSPPDEGALHAEKDFTGADYESNPPASGTHSPTWYEDGIYASGTTPELGRLVHTLEHGRIDVQYTPGTPAATVARFEQLLDELDGGYHMLLFENGTDMPYAVAATAWDHVLGCPSMNERVFDAVRAFRNTYVDKGPETVP